MNWETSMMDLVKGIYNGMNVHRQGLRYIYKIGVVKVSIFICKEHAK